MGHTYMKLKKLFSLNYWEKFGWDIKPHHLIKKRILLKFCGIKISLRIDHFINNFCTIKSELAPYRPRPLQDEPAVYLSIAAILKNEAPYIKEWIEFHKLVGVERFYLYDNESTDNVKEILEPYIQDGTVIYKYVAGPKKQHDVYRDAIYKSRTKTYWLAIIDLDEYLFPVEKDNLKDFLKDYEAYPAVVANWVMFDSNGLLEHPDGKLITEVYTRVHKSYNKSVNWHVKSIVNPDKVRYLQSSHCCFYENNENAVTENFEKCIGPFTKYNSVKKIRINHYHTKSLKDYKQKVEKGYADQTNPRPFNESYLNFPETTQDYAIHKYLPELKQKMRQK